MLDLPVPRCIMGDFRDQLVTDRFAGYGFKKGDYVVVEVEILTPDERAPQVPDDTKEVSFIALYKGYLRTGQPMLVMKSQLKQLSDAKLRVS